MKQHFCSNENPCVMNYHSPGVCNVVTELLRQKRSFHGKRSDFDYDYVSEQFEERKGYCLTIPPFQRAHTCSHVHSTNENVLHFCDNRCPACNHYYHLPTRVNAPSLPIGTHNCSWQVKWRFVSEVEEIDLLDKRYIRGDTGVVEMCMMHCKARGRGHTHLVPCPGHASHGRCLEKLFDGLGIQRKNVQV
ncbi:hypothetical protein L7F22_002452 [Adiantum nelumboides]|nr:hypothetical protein [Adiantum nelumboides]